MVRMACSIGGIVHLIDRWCGHQLFHKNKSNTLMNTFTWCSGHIQYILLLFHGWGRTLGWSGELEAMEILSICWIDGVDLIEFKWRSKHLNLTTIGHCHGGFFTFHQFLGRVCGTYKVRFILPMPASMVMVMSKSGSECTVVNTKCQPGLRNGGK